MLHKRRRPYRAGSVVAVVAVAVSLFVVDAPAGASPSPINRTNSQISSLQAPRRGPRRGDHIGPEQGLDSGRAVRRADGAPAGGPGNSRQDRARAQGDPTRGRGRACPGTDSSDRCLRDRRRTRLASRRDPRLERERRTERGGLLGHRRSRPQRSREPPARGQCPAGRRADDAIENARSCGAIPARRRTRPGSSPRQRRWQRTRPSSRSRGSSIN